jgi:hypothetical protein
MLPSAVDLPKQNTRSNDFTGELKKVTVAVPVSIETTKRRRYLVTCLAVFGPFEI